MHDLKSEAYIDDEHEGLLVHVVVDGDHVSSFGGPQKLGKVKLKQEDLLLDGV